MLRFEIGSRVQLIGALAEDFDDMTAVVVRLQEHESGRTYLNTYWLRWPDGTEERFYHFQLANEPRALGRDAVCGEVFGLQLESEESLG
jgi:hypothetical protein